MKRDILQDLTNAYALDWDAHVTITVDGATTYDGPIAELPLPVVLMADYSRECGHIVEVHTNAVKSSGGNSITQIPADTAKEQGKYFNPTPTK